MYKTRVPIPPVRDLCEYWRSNKNMFTSHHLQGKRKRKIKKSEIKFM